MQEKQSVHFLHIGKTGGTAIKYALSESLTDGPYAIFLHGHGVKLRDVPEGEGVAFFLRDPVSRFASGFFSRQRQGQPIGFWPWNHEERKAFEYFSTPNELASSLTARSRARRLRARNAMQGIRHVKDSFWRWFENEEYFRSRSSDIFFVGFQETLAKDFEALRSRLQLRDRARLPDDDLLAHRNPPHLDTTLDERAVGNLKRWYRDGCEVSLMGPREAYPSDSHTGRWPIKPVNCCVPYGSALQECRR